MSEYNPKIHSKHFASFVSESPQYRKLYKKWLFAEKSGSPKEAFRLGERLFHLMRVNGWA